jgi:hypothetical protein
MTSISHANLLQRLGTNTQIGDALGLDHTTISRWRTEGIPPRNWVAIALVAQQAGIRITAEDIARAYFKRTRALRATTRTTTSKGSLLRKQLVQPNTIKL